MTSKTEQAGQQERGCAQHTPGPVGIGDLPLGSLFRYAEHSGPDDPCFVLLDRGAGGLCAQAPHTCASAVMQGIYAIADSDAELRAMRFHRVNAHDGLVGAVSVMRRAIAGGYRLTADELAGVDAAIAKTTGDRT